MPTVAPAAKSILTQATLYRPNRSKASDGTLGDAAHRKRKSDHNPNAAGVVMASDLTNDPAHGMDAHAWIRWRVLKNDPRIKYAISFGEWWKPDGQGWRPYTGLNPHDKHVHTSIANGYENDSSEWFQGFLFDTPQPTLKTPQKDDDDMGTYIFDTVNLVHFHLYGERFRQLSTEQFVKRQSLAKLGGVTIEPQRMHPWAIAQFLISFKLIEDLPKN